MFNGKVGVPVGGATETIVAGDFEIQLLLNEEGTLSAKFFSRESEIQEYLADRVKVLLKARDFRMKLILIVSKNYGVCCSRKRKKRNQLKLKLQ